MFDRLADAEVIESITASARAENAAGARRLLAIAEMYARRHRRADSQRPTWLVDHHDGLVAEVAAALGISRTRAANEVRFAVALRERLPRVAQRYAAGELDYRVVSTAVTRTELIEDAGLLAKVDAALGRYLVHWGALAEKKLIARIDWWVAKFDPPGVRERPAPDSDRFVDIAPTSPGMASVVAALRAVDAAVLDRTLAAQAAAVCPADPRTTGQRRADALAALAAGQELSCRCGAPDCAAKPAGAAAASVVVQVLAEHDTVVGAGTTPGLVPGFGPVPAEQVRDLARLAKTALLQLPSSVAEAHYRPSQALAQFVRARDLTCRFPGCHQPAEVCDIDTVAYPAGPTHPSNLKLLCRHHHLLKTFFGGTAGWTDTQLPDGTVIWCAPTGHTYRTTPEGAFYFPVLGTPTSEPPRNTGTATSHPTSGPTMPTRKRTRAQQRRDRITDERRRNAERIADRDHRREHRYEWFTHPPEPTGDEEPPPF
ncbi:HNH endonuclease signature motif containing protein [Mycolicibacterium palauense]|uniref:HNH endonuclease signature motif containing protein n=1 Tax=Mycolicibacterium palauense TaxID=2034511 RepID=UPI000BFEBDD6|nr:HNH endonuclease signature motif containing protein [Mycolicibacterium palauense]